MAFQMTFVENVLQHKLQMYGLSPEWALAWYLSVDLCPNTFWHKLHM